MYVCAYCLFFVCVHLCEREHKRSSKVQKEKKQQEEMKRLNDEPKEKSKKGGKNDTKEVLRKNERKQVCKCITFQQSSMHKITQLPSLLIGNHGISV